MNASIGQTIKAVRQRAGITQVELAQKLGVTDARVSQIENGTRNTKLSAIQRIAAALEVPVSVLLEPILYEEMNMKFYFTYGTDGQPFVGGWTEVEAPDHRAACAAFRAYHPDKIPNCLNCSSIYTEEQFKKTGMAGPDGNFGRFCHERITLRREAVTN